MIKHIFLDMVGPLLNNQREVSSGNSQDLKKAQIPVSPVSARTPMGNEWYPPYKKMMQRVSM